MKRIFLPLAAGLVILVLFLGWNDRLDWSPVSEGVILHEGTEVPLPPDLCRELVDGISTPNLLKCNFLGLP